MVRRRLSYSWTDIMSIEEANALMTKAADIDTLRKDIIRKEMDMEEYLKEHGLENYYRTDSEVIESAIRQSLIKSKELMLEANKKMIQSFKMSKAPKVKEIK